MNENIEKILVNFLMNTSNIEELEILKDWLKKDEHRQIFKSYIKTNYAMDINLSEFDSENAKTEYLRKIRRDKNMLHKLKIYRVLKYAAAAVILFGLGYFYQQGVFNSPIGTSPTIVNTDIQTGTDKAILTLEDGSKVALEKGQKYTTDEVDSNGEDLIYNTKKSKTAITFNYLTIPRGGEYHIQLSDGTEVWLNSESQLKYPVSFREGETREVELVYGEAYFDVSPSTEHEGSKFKVFNLSQEIEVFGTEFNIKAYKDETNVYTTLVEGLVSVGFDGKSQYLTPSQQSNLNIESKSLAISKVDVYNEIAWKDGIFSFEEESLQEIMKVLSRWYDLEVVFENEDIKSEEFYGLLRKDQNIEKILTTIKNYGIIEEFEIKNKILVLK